MISKLKLGAITIVAAAGLASPAFAQMQVNSLGNAAHPSIIRVADSSPGANGGGSTGYNERASGPNYRLKKHSQAPDPQHPATDTK